MPGTKTTKARKGSTCCAPLVGPGGRAHITVGQAAELMGIFKTLANDTRLRLLHALVCAGELCVTGLADALEMKPQAVSNQLQRLVDRRILASRRQGNNVYYRVVNECVTDLLDRGLCLVEERCEES